jgi:hypothetical protein
VTATEYRQALDSLPFGKRLPGAVYLIDPGNDLRIPAVLRITVSELRKRMEIGVEFNLLKFHTASPKISFLSYPEFEKDPHPTLMEAVIVDLVTGKTRRDDYRARANPPILHRKETFLPPEHPLHDKFAKLTRQEESVGLLEDTARIGFRLNWERTLAEKFLGFKGQRLVETAPATPSAPAPPKKKIHRHKTAIVRREISKPVKTLLELGYDEREPVEVRISPEEIVIVNYPGPDRSVRLDQLRQGKAIPRRYRNRRIGDFLKELEITEGRSTGIPKILRAMKKNGSPPPVFDFDEDHSYFLIRLPVHRKAKSIPTQEDVGHVNALDFVLTLELGRLITLRPESFANQSGHKWSKS